MRCAKNLFCGAVVSGVLFTALPGCSADKPAAVPDQEVLKKEADKHRQMHDEESKN